MFIRTCTGRLYLNVQEIAYFEIVNENHPESTVQVNAVMRHKWQAEFIVIDELTEENAVGIINWIVNCKDTVGLVDMAEQKFYLKGQMPNEGVVHGQGRMDQWSEGQETGRAEGASGSKAARAGQTAGQEEVRTSQPQRGPDRQQRP